MVIGGVREWPSFPAGSNFIAEEFRNLAGIQQWSESKGHVFHYRCRNLYSCSVLWAVLPCQYNHGRCSTYKYPAPSVDHLTHHSHQLFPPSTTTPSQYHTMRSLKTPAKRPPLGPRALDTPAKREVHLPFTARKRLFTSTASAVFIPQQKTLRTPGWHERGPEMAEIPSTPLRLTSRTSPARHGEDTLSEEVLKSLFARWFPPFLCTV